MSNNMVCIPGQQIECACPGGAKGAQKCLPDGTGYDTCLGCGDAPGGGGGGGAGGGEVGGAGGQAGSPGSGGAGGGGGAASSSGAGGLGGGGGGAPCGASDDDTDLDGFTEDAGDCNDCDPFVNPGATEVLGNAVDDDCDGQADNPEPPCDSAISVNSSDPLSGAKAIGLCKYVTNAKWTLADGSPPPVDPVQLANFHLGHGVLDNLGPNNPPREGAKLLALSSGTARNVGDPDYVHRNFVKGYSSNAPFGFPKESAACPGIATKLPRDATGLEVTIKAPTNAQAFSFELNFFTFEWPSFICSSFNDIFAALLTPFPSMQLDGNIAFDTAKNPISVNSAFLDACGCPGAMGPPCAAPPMMQPSKSYPCSLGTGTLVGTDFGMDDGNAEWSNGATGWLRASAPVDPGAVFTIRLVTYDSGDGNVDSTTLLDSWQWSPTPASVKTVPAP